MKRRIDICRKCGKFCHDNEDVICLASDDAMVRLIHFVSENLGIPKDFFFDEEGVTRPSRKDDFNEKDVPADCEMKEVYLVCEWTNEKKT